MYTRILVPLDGSPRAERALPVAARIARASGGTIILATVVALPIRYESGDYDPLSSETVDAECQDADMYLQQVSQLPILAGVVTKSVVKMGSPAPSLLEAIASHEADLVAMTSHGRTGISRWALGSVTQHLVRYTEVPVLVLREQGSNLAVPHPDIEHLFRVLVSLDGSPHAEVALVPAMEMALSITEKNQAGLHLLLVIPPYEVDQANMPEALILDGAKAYLGEIAKRLQKEYPGVTVTWSVGVGLDVAATIIRVAENGEDVEGAGVFGGCDVVALATHGRTGMARWALGSIAERVLYDTKLPILIVRPRETTKGTSPKAPGDASR